ncbi:MAG: hypothetical protein KF886_15405 [Candidatus Hydrogenedentes bacterium]|nr:hypothetical protein [Candidatus Hydrogenedentota bacterium]
MTADRVYVSGGTLTVTFLRLPRTDLGTEPIYQALKNHYKLVRTYNGALRSIQAGLLDVRFDPHTGCPKKEVSVLPSWDRIQGFETQDLLLHNLLKTFFPEALLDERRLDASTVSLLKHHKLESVNLDKFYYINGLHEVRSPIEEEIRCSNVQQDTFK